MKQVGKILTINYFIILALTLAVIVCGENDWLINVGIMHSNKNSDFLMTSIMEIITICLIPIALRLFKFKKVRNDIVSDNNLAKEQIWEFSNGMYYHEEYYYNNKYMMYEL